MKPVMLFFFLAMMIGFGHEPVDVNEVPLNQEFDLKAGEEVVIKGTKLKVKFLEVLEDSRCPEDVQCVWQGNGKLNLELKKSNRKTAVATVNTGLEPKQASFKKSTVRLVKLSPNPRSNVKIEPDQYVATLIVTRR